MSDVRDRRQDFIRTYEATYVDVVRFVARRVDRDEAEDLAAEAFTVAWRRLGDLPDTTDECRAWVFGIARRLVLAHHRKRVGPLPITLSDDLPVAGPEDSAVLLADLAAAWGRLRASHQEALSLQLWEGLSSTDAATVLGISAIAYRIRLSRARAALGALIGTRAPGIPEGQYQPTSSEEGTRR